MHKPKCLKCTLILHLAVCTVLQWSNKHVEKESLSFVILYLTVHLALGIGTEPV